MKRLRLEEITPEFLASLKYSPVTPEELEEILALAQTIFAPADLQRHLERDDGVSADDVLAELEEAQKEFDAHR